MKEKLLDWWRGRKYKREQQALALAEKRRSDVADTQEAQDTRG